MKHLKQKIKFLITEINVHLWIPLWRVLSASNDHAQTPKEGKFWI